MNPSHPNRPSPPLFPALPFWSFTILALAAALAAPRASAQQKALEVRTYRLGAVQRLYGNAQFLLAPREPLALDDSDGPRYVWPAIGLPEEPTPSPADAQRVGETGGVLDDSEGSAVEQLQSHCASLGLVQDGEEAAIERLPGEVARVRASASAHATLGAWLADLESRAAARIAVRCVVVTLAALDGVQPNWRDSAQALPAEVFARAVATPGSALLELECRNGQQATASSEGLAALLADFEVNQTGVIPVVKPRIHSARDGHRLEVCPRWVPSSDAVWLDLAVGIFSRPENRKGRLGAQWSDLELPVTDEVIVSVSLPAPLRQTVVAGWVERADAGFAVLVQATALRAAPPRPPAAVAGQPLLRTYDLSLFARTFPTRAWTRPSQNEAAVGFAENREASTVVDSELDLSRFLEQAAAEAKLEEGSVRWAKGGSGLVFVSAPSGIHDRLDSAIRDDLRRLARSAFIELQLISLSRPQLAQVLEAATDGYVLSPGWDKVLGDPASVERSRFALSGASGEVHALRAARQEAYVADVELVSGGTGFAITVEADPIVDSFGSGTNWMLRADLPEGEGPARISLRGVSAQGRIERSIRSRSPKLPEGLTGGSEGQRDAGQTPAAKGTLEIELMMPRQRLSSWSIDRELPLGREVLLRAEADPSEKSATLLVGRVRRWSD